MTTCSICGEPMPPGEQMFKYHGYSGPCPKPAAAMTTDKAAAPVGAVPQGDAFNDDVRRLINGLPDVARNLEAEGQSSRAEVVADACRAIRRLQAALASQAARMGELEQDAARYRWLRDHAELVDDADYWLPIVCAWDFKPGPQLNERHASLDAAIDKLRGEAGQS